MAILFALIFDWSVIVLTSADWRLGSLLKILRLQELLFLFAVAIIEAVSIRDVVVQLLLVED